MALSWPGPLRASQGPWGAALAPYLTDTDSAIVQLERLAFTTLG